MAGGEAGPGVRRHVALAGLLGGGAGLLLAVLSVAGAFEGLGWRARGLVGLAIGLLVFAAWYVASALRGGAARGMTRWELAEALASYVLVLLSSWVGFYNALGGGGG